MSCGCVFLVFNYRTEVKILVEYFPVWPKCVVGFFFLSNVTLSNLPIRSSVPLRSAVYATTGSGRVLVTSTH